MYVVRETRAVVTARRSGGRVGARGGRAFAWRPPAKLPLMFAAGAHSKASPYFFFFPENSIPFKVSKKKKKI